MKKTERIGLTLTRSEKAVAKRLAQIEGGLSLAALVRRVIRQSAQTHGLWPPDDEALDQWRSQTTDRTTLVEEEIYEQN
jgi:hypothetical protein